MPHCFHPFVDSQHVRKCCWCDLLQVDEFKTVQHGPHVNERTSQEFVWEQDLDPCVEREALADMNEGPA